jgi:hypothetical protein
LVPFVGYYCRVPNNVGLDDVDNAAYIAQMEDTSNACSLPNC